MNKIFASDNLNVAKKSYHFMSSLSSFAPLFIPVLNITRYDRYKKKKIKFIFLFTFLRSRKD